MMRPTEALASPAQYLGRLAHVAIYVAISLLGSTESDRSNEECGLDDDDDDDDGDDDDDDDDLLSHYYKGNNQKQVQAGSD